VPRGHAREEFAVFSRRVQAQEILKPDIQTHRLLHAYRNVLLFEQQHPRTRAGAPLL
jgi:hypothetical protein